jgi:hypothetical protein
MDFVTTKINNLKVRKVPLRGPEDTRKIKGAAMFPEVYANIFLCARKKSGKTSCLYKILKGCSGSNTKIIAFCSTLHKDASWGTIQEWADEKGLPFVGHTSLKDDEGMDQLDALVNELAEPEEEEEEKPKTDWIDTGYECSEEEEKPRKSRYRYPEYIIVLDDLSTELKSKSVTALLKKNRHFRAKIIISSQYLNDLLPEARKQLDYLIAFAGHPEKKLLEIHRDTDVHIPMNEFVQVYKFATSTPYSFLYIDCTNGQFRKNFNELIKI